MTAASETYSPYGCRPTRRIFWGAIIAGALLALVTLFTLSVLGAAIGLTVLNPTDQNSAQGVGIGATIWWIVTAIIALFFGGWAAARLSGIWGSGCLQGLTTWALTLVIIGWMLTSAAGKVMGGALSTLQSAVQSGAAANEGAIQAIQQKLEQLAGKARQEAEQTTPEKKEQAAQKATDVSAAAAWGSFVMLILCAIAAAIGGSVGAHCNKRHDEEAHGTTVRT
ncbi:MAG: hypothetical protein LLF76_10885 [Planctomycetaceae bacterium]|nr:hypothetical protein [Planctomycetaceae bacterium]